MKKIIDFAKKNKELIAIIGGAILLIGVILLVSAQCIDTVNYNEADFILDGTRHTVKVLNWEYEDGGRTMKIRAEDGMIYYVPYEQCILYSNYHESLVTLAEISGEPYRVANLKTSFDSMGFYYQAYYDIDTKNWGRQKRIKVFDGIYALIPADFLADTISKKEYEELLFENQKASIRNAYKGYEIFFSVDSGYNSEGVCTIDYIELVDFNTVKIFTQEGEEYIVEKGHVFSMKTGLPLFEN